MSLAVSKCTFVLVQITRYQQIIGVYTLQAPSETAKVRVFALPPSRFILFSAVVMIRSLL